jgi:hypothetical protein
MRRSVVFGHCCLNGLVLHTSAATHRPAGVRPSPDRQRIEEARAHGLTRRVSNEVPRDFGCTSWASGAGPPRGSDGFSHGETRRLPEARWQRRVVVRPQDYSGFGLKPQKPTPKSAQLASRALEEHSSGGGGFKRSQCGRARRAWAGSPRCSVVWRIGSNVLNNRKGRPRLSSVILPPPFQLAETTLLAIGLGRDDGSHSVVHELVDERIGVIRLIGNDRTRVGMFEQWFSASKIVILPSG